MMLGMILQMIPTQNNAWKDMFKSRCSNPSPKIPFSEDFFLLTAEWTERSSVESTGDLTTIFKE